MKRRGPFFYFKGKKNLFETCFLVFRVQLHLEAQLRNVVSLLRLRLEGEKKKIARQTLVVILFSQRFWTENHTVKNTYGVCYHLLRLCVEEKDRGFSQISGLLLVRVCVCVCVRVFRTLRV